MPFIGIDLGTTFSCVASAKKGLPEVIANDQGSRTTPSCVAFVDCNRLIGEAAVQQIARNPLNTVFDVKRLMGRSFNEPCVTEDRRRLPYEVCNDNGKPKVTVFYKGEKKQFSPEQISSMILERMKKFAEDFLGEGVMGAVITVPAYFNDAQRRATRDAAAVAKIHVLGLINEPTAAAIAYGLEKDPDVSRNVLIFDLGGGTFDVTVMTINNGEFTVKATDGDTHLGGEDFNNRLFNHFAQEIKKKHGVDIKTRLRPASRLRNKCEEAKKILSTTTRANIELDGLIDGEDFDTHMTRVRFEQLNDDLFRGTMETVHKTLDAAGMTVAEIDEVVLIGGSTRIPAIQKQLQDVFGAEKIHKTINPEEAVAVGAAAYAESFSKSPLPKARKFVLHDVTPLSLGIATLGDVMTVVVKRNTQIPVKKNHIFTTVKDDQTVVNFKVYEGERYVAKQNHLLGNFKLEDITLAPAGVPSLKTCFEIDKDGVLEVTAVDEGTENKNSVKITKEGRETDEEEIQRMVEEAEVFRKDDEEWRLRVQAANELEACANRTRNKLVDGEIPKDSEIQKLRAIETCDEILQFVAEKRDPDVGEITEKMAQLKHVMDVD